MAVTEDYFFFGSYEWIYFLDFLFTWEVRKLCRNSEAAETFNNILSEFFSKNQELQEITVF